MVTVNSSKWNQAWPVAEVAKHSVNAKLILQRCSAVKLDTSTLQIFACSRVFVFGILQLHFYHVFMGLFHCTNQKAPVHVQVNCRTHRQSFCRVWSFLASCVAYRCWKDVLSCLYLQAAIQRMVTFYTYS